MSARPYTYRSLFSAALIALKYPPRRPEVDEAAVLARLADLTAVTDPWTAATILFGGTR